MQYAIVKWIDAHSLDPWEERSVIEDDHMNGCEIYSIGHIVAENEDTIALAVAFAPIDDKMACTMIIPKRCIVDIKKHQHQDENQEVNHEPEAN